MFPLMNNKTMKNKLLFCFQLIMQNKLVKIRVEPLCEGEMNFSKLS